MDQLLALLSADARLTNAQLAAALSISEEEVAAQSSKSLRKREWALRKLPKSLPGSMKWKVSI